MALRTSYFKAYRRHVCIDTDYTDKKLRCDTNMKSPLADKFLTNQRRDKTDFWQIRGVQIKTFNQ